METTKQELADYIEELEQYKGRATELITVYIPAGQNLYTVIDQLEAEKSTAKNIKSTSTRKNVGNALDKITRYLRDYKKTPEKGLAVFCGNVSQVEGQDNLKLWDIEPPITLKTRMYRCDKEFILGPLKDMLEVSEVFGLLVMDRKEATIGLLEGKSIKIFQKMTSGIPSKIRAGGQCLSPEMIIETKNGIKPLKYIKIGDNIKSFNLDTNKIVFTKLKNKWEVKKNKYLEIKIKDCWPILSSYEHLFFKDEEGKIVEIPAESLNKGNNLISFSNNNLVYYQIEEINSFNKKINLIDIETESKNFFANGILVHNSSQRFHRITEGLTKEFYKRIAEEMKNLFYEMPKLKGILIGGPIPTKDEFLEGEYLPTQLRNKIIAIKDLGGSDEAGIKELVEKSRDILSEQEIIQEKKIIEKFFQTLGEKPELAVYKEENIRKALQYGAVETLIISKKADKILSKELKKLAENISSEIIIISDETEEGKQFLNITKGIGAILRFRI